MRKFSAFILKLIGWKTEGITDYPAKCVLCVAPHTSNWDLILGKIIYSSLGRKASFLIKKTWFFFPMNLIFRAIGGIPVDRSKKTSLTEQMAEEFAKRESFELAITPEGTRKKNDDWKKGFYYIALAAKVPIVIVVLDYKDKTTYFRDTFYPTGEVDRDIEIIKSYYKDAKGKHQEKFSLGDEQ
ncbi:MAG: 1-acyl-sn-glycerol-3-phosphate acyltransferase [Dysgonomonas sp.]|nr:1-acyl-sn-glycerol-3-phosphate acyltransferase [Dysgonomonas sp.]